MRRYLEAIAQAGGDGEPAGFTVEQAQERLQQAVQRLADWDGKNQLRRLELVQNVHAATQRVERAEARSETVGSLAEQAAAFEKVCVHYSERKGITWDAWRAVGVPAAVLKNAGMPRGS